MCLIRNVKYEVLQMALSPSPELSAFGKVQSRICCAHFLIGLALS